MLCFLHQVYVGGDINGRITLQDDTDAVNMDNFVMHPGATLQPVCGAHNTALHFSGMAFDPALNSSSTF